MSFKDIEMILELKDEHGRVYASQSNLLKDDSVVKCDSNNVTGVHTSKRPDGWYKCFDKKRTLI